MLTVLTVALVSAACSSDSESPTVQPNPTATQQATSDSESSTVQPNPTATQQATSDSESFVAEPLDINVLFPLDGQTLNTEVVRVLVESVVGVQVAVNGELSSANIDGTFFSDITLEDGMNLIEVTGINIDGSVDSEQLIVFANLESESVALSIVSPQDGAIVPSTAVEVVGITSVDSVVQVNGIEAVPDGSGIFQVTVQLEPGSNLIEVIAADLAGQSITEELVVFSVSK